MDSRRYRAFFTPIALGYGVFAVLLVFSILFCLERTCYADIAFQVFEIINTRQLFYQQDRFGAIFIQMFPLIAVLIGLPLKSVLLSYSVALVLQNLFFYWLLHKVLKQKQFALALMLYNVLMVSETFYWATNEIKQGFSFSILFAGVISALPLEQFSGIRKVGLLLLYFGILVTAIFLHPLVMFAIAFVIGYVALHKRAVLSQTILWSAGMVALIIGSKYLLMPVAPYDTEQISTTQNFITFFPNYLALPSFRQFFLLVLYDWYLYGILFIVVAAFQAYNRQWLKLGWQLLFSIGYLTMLAVTHLHSQKPFIESYYQALAVFILVPFAIDFLPAIKVQYALVLLVVICGLRLNTIFHNHNKYTEHIAVMQRAMTLFEGKFVVPADRFPGHKDIMVWGVPNGSALLSSLASPDSCRSFVVIRDVTAIGSDENSFYTVFRQENYSAFNPHYFRPAPGRYRILTDEELLKLKIPE